MAAVRKDYDRFAVTAAPLGLGPGAEAWAGDATRAPREVAGGRPGASRRGGLPKPPSVDRAASARGTAGAAGGGARGARRIVAQRDPPYGRPANPPAATRTASATFSFNRVLLQPNARRPATSGAASPNLWEAWDGTHSTHRLWDACHYDGTTRAKASPRGRSGALTSRAHPSTTKTLHAYNNFLSPREGRLSASQLSTRRTSIQRKTTDARGVVRTYSRSQGNPPARDNTDEVTFYAEPVEPGRDNGVVPPAEDDGEGEEVKALSETRAFVQTLVEQLSRISEQRQEKEKVLEAREVEFSEVDGRVKARSREGEAKRGQEAVFFQGKALDITTVGAYETLVPVPGTIAREISTTTIEELTARENECLFHIDAARDDALSWGKIFRRERALVPDLETKNNRIYDDMEKMNRELDNLMRNRLIAKRSQEAEEHKVEKFKHILAIATKRRENILKTARGNYEYSHARTLRKQKEEEEANAALERKRERERKKKATAQGLREMRAPLELQKAEREEARKEALMQKIIDMLGMNDWGKATGAVIGVLSARSKTLERKKEAEAKVVELQSSLASVTREFDDMRLMGQARVRQRAFEAQLDEIRDTSVRNDKRADETRLRVLREIQTLDETDLLLDCLLSKAKRITKLTLDDIISKRTKRAEGSDTGGDAASAGGDEGDAAARDTAAPDPFSDLPDDYYPPSPTRSPSHTLGDALPFEPASADPLERDEARARRLFIKLELFEELMADVLTHPEVTQHSEIMALARAHMDDPAAAVQAATRLKRRMTITRRSSGSAMSEGAARGFDRMKAIARASVTFGVTKPALALGGGG